MTGHEEAVKHRFEFTITNNYTGVTSMTISVILRTAFTASVQY